MIFDLIKACLVKTLLHAVDHDVDAVVEFSSDVVSDDACSVVTHVV